MISIIIPVFNEAENIDKLLTHLAINATSSVAIRPKMLLSEILIIDGGSEDETQKVVEKFMGSHDRLNVKFIHSKKGRAQQMNVGASKAAGSILYFLHADSFPPVRFDHLILNEIEKGNPAGCFRMKFDSNHWWLQLAGWFTRFNFRACRGGDQSQFITKNLFQEIGGYNERFRIYEDNILIQELYARKKFVVIQKTLVSSARLYRQKGVWSLQYHFLMIYYKKWMGATPEDLYAYYSKHIKTPQINSAKHTFTKVIADR